MKLLPVSIFCGGEPSLYGDTERMRTVTLPIAPSANRYWRHVGRKVLVSEEARAYRQRAGLIAVASGLRPFGCPVVLCLDFCGLRANADLSNRIKVTEDALNGIAYDDDNQVVALVVRRFDDGNKCVRISVMPALVSTEQEYTVHAPMGGKVTVTNG